MKHGFLFTIEIISLQSFQKIWNPDYNEFLNFKLKEVYEKDQDKYIDQVKQFWIKLSTFINLSIIHSCYYSTK